MNPYKLKANSTKPWVVYQTVQTTTSPMLLTSKKRNFCLNRLACGCLNHLWSGEVYSKYLDMQLCNAILACLTLKVHNTQNAWYTKDEWIRTDGLISLPDTLWIVMRIPLPMKPKSYGYFLSALNHLCNVNHITYKVSFIANNIFLYRHEKLIKSQIQSRSQ